MARKTPSTKIGVIGPASDNVLNGITDMFEMKTQNNFIKPPNWDSVADTIEMLYIRNHRERDTLKTNQNELLKLDEKQKRLNQMRTKRLYKDQAELRLNFIKTNEFVKTCRDKHKSTQEKLKEELKIQNEYQRKVDSLRNVVSFIGDFEKELEMESNKYAPYEELLEEAVSNSDYLVSINDLMARVDALLLVQLEIQTIYIEKLAHIEELRHQMIQISKDTAKEIMGLRNQITELERGYKKAHASAMHWEFYLSRAKNFINEQELNRERTLDGIYNLYRLLCNRRGIETDFLRHEVGAVLNFIREENVVLTATLEEFKNHPKMKKEEVAIKPRQIC